MSFGPPRVRSMNISDPENKKPPPSPTAKKAAVKKPGKTQTPTKEESNSRKCSGKAASVLRQKSMNASCSSEASSDSASVASSSSSAAERLAAVGRGRDGVIGVRPRKQCGVRIDKEGKGNSPASDGGLVVVESSNEARDDADGGVESKVKSDCFEQKKRCGWVTPSSDPCYAMFHDEEWGVPVHNDKNLFELLSLSGALAELTWPVILSKRHIFREVFLDFDPFAVSRLSEKKLVMPGSPASNLLSEQKLRSIVENARQMCKVIDEFGSFNKYIWNFVNHKPIVNQFRYSRQVPVKTSKADAISKDLVKRGFRSVGPTVIYSFMQVAGLTNDHLISCFRYQECITGSESKEKDEATKARIEKKESDAAIDAGRGDYGLSLTK